MIDFLKIAKSIVVHFAHICAYGVETVNFILSLDRKYICEQVLSTLQVMIMI